MMSKRKEIKISEIIIPKYYDVFNDKKHTHVILTSGRAGTKSSFVAIKCDHKIISEKDCAVVVMRKFHNKLKKTVYKEMLRGMKRLGLNKTKHFKTTVSPMEIQYKKNGNTIYFTGNDSIDDTKGMIDESKPIKLVVLDELTEFFDKGEGEDELSNIEATFIRGNDEEFQMIYLFNPPKNPNAPIMQWLKKMKQREDTIHIHVDYRDVPVSWLGKKLIESAEIMKKVAEKLYNWVWLGQCIGVEDLIYHMFDENVHVYQKELSDDEKKSMGEIGIGVDYGQKNPTTFEAFGIDYNQQLLRGLDEYYHCGREDGQKSPSEYAKDFKEFCEKIEKEYNRVISWVFIDPSAQGLSEEIKRLMPYITIKNADNSVALGISRMQKLFSFRKMILSYKQKRLIEELGQYRYDEESIKRGKEVPVKESDHCLTGDTLIDTVDGQIAIKDLIGKRGMVYCYDMKRKKKTISKFYDVRKTQENADVYEVKLNNGSSVKATEKHRFYTQRGWIKLKDLKENDRIVKI